MRLMMRVTKRAAIAALGLLAIGGGMQLAAEPAPQPAEVEAGVQAEPVAPQADGSPLQLRVEPRPSIARVVRDPTTRPVLPLVPVRTTPVPAREVKLVVLPRPALEQGLLVMAQEAARPDRPRLRSGRRLVLEPVVLPNPLLRLPMVVRPRAENAGVPGEASLDLLGRPVLPPYKAFRTTAVSVETSVPPDPLVNPNAVRLAQPPADDDPPAAAPVYLPRPALPASVPEPQ